MCVVIVDFVCFFVLVTRASYSARIVFVFVANVRFMFVCFDFKVIVNCVYFFFV